MRVDGLLIGILTGGMMVLGVTVALLCLKAIQFRTGPSGAGKQHLFSTSPIPMLLFVALEELVFRHLGVGWLSGLVPVGAAVAISAVLFYVIHIPNGPPQSILICANSLLWSVVASLLYLRGGFWAAVGFHWGWNVMQYHVLGYSLYGRPVGRWIHVVPIGPVWLSGGGHGPEQSLLSIVALGAGVLLFWLP